MNLKNRLNAVVSILLIAMVLASTIGITIYGHSCTYSQKNYKSLLIPVKTCSHIPDNDLQDSDNCCKPEKQPTQNCCSQSNEDKNCCTNTHEFKKISPKTIVFYKISNSKPIIQQLFGIHYTNIISTKHQLAFYTTPIHIQASPPTKTTHDFLSKIQVYQI